MAQLNLTEFAFPDETDIGKESESVVQVRNPEMLAECLVCGAALENMDMLTASGGAEDRKGEWMFSCRTPWCNEYTRGGAGCGSAKVIVEGGKIVDIQTNDAKVVSAGMVSGSTSDGIPIIRPDKYESVRRDQDDDYNPEEETEEKDQL